MNFVRIFIGISLINIGTSTENDVVAPVLRTGSFVVRDGNVFQAIPISVSALPFDKIKCGIACLKTPTCQYIQINTVRKTCSLLSAGGRATTFNDSIIYQVQQRSAQVTVLYCNKIINSTSIKQLNVKYFLIGMLRNIDYFLSIIDF